MITYPNTPGHKGTDTSFDAAKSMQSRAETLRQLALDKIEKSLTGLTADRCADILNESILSIRPRLSELRRLGLIMDSGRRGTNTSGKKAVVWVAKYDGDMTKKHENPDLFD